MKNFVLISNNSEQYESWPFVAGVCHCLKKALIVEIHICRYAQYNDVSGRIYDGGPIIL